MKRIFLILLLLLAYKANAQKNYKHLTKNCIPEFKFCVAYPSDFRPESANANPNGKKFINDQGFLIQGTGRLKSKSETIEALHQERLADIKNRFDGIGSIGADDTEKKRMFFIGWETKEKEYIECTFFKGKFIKTINIECPQGGLDSRDDLLDVLGFFSYTASRNISNLR
jgi:hypothetical protein